MDNLGKTILVPYDFSQVADYALQHAIRVAQVINQGITLLYIVSSPTEIYMMEDKLSEVSRKTREKFGIEPLTIVRTGSIFVDIAIVAQEIDACMVIMGSHSIRGKEEITGSLAHKVIVS